MTRNELAQQIDIEFERIQMTVDQLVSLRNDLAHRDPTIRELAAAGLFLSNFYSGIENVLKRICRFHQVDLPVGSDWHLELIKAFCDPALEELPLLLDGQLANELAPYRQFRHVIHHGYGFRLRWLDMLPGVDGASSIFARFKSAVDEYLRRHREKPEET
jgi:hypothetical protein